MRTFVKTFKSLGDKNRIRILKMLEVKPMCVCEITSLLGLAPSTVSKHLSLLSDAGLIADIREGKWVNYTLVQKNGPNLRSDLLGLMHRSLNDDPVIKKDKIYAGKVNRRDLCVQGQIPSNNPGSVL